MTLDYPQKVCHVKTIKPLPIFYFILAVVGLCITWYYNILYFAGGGSVAPNRFFGSAFANNLTTAITIDIYFSALAFSVWVWFEAKTNRLKWPIIYIALCFGIGLAVALPFFLGVRELAISRGKLNDN